MSFTYELWVEKDEDGAVSTAFFPEYNKSARATLEPGATLAGVVKASSWSEALVARDSLLKELGL